MADVVERRPIEARLTILANVMAANPIALHTREVKAEAQAAITEAAREIEALRKNETELRDSMNALLDDRALSQAGAGGLVDEKAFQRALETHRGLAPAPALAKVIETYVAALAASPSAGDERAAWTSPADAIRSRMTVLYTPPAPVQTASVEAVVSKTMREVIGSEGGVPRVDYYALKKALIASLTAPTQGDGA